MPSAPQVKSGVLTDSNKPLYPAIKVGSKFWFTWLKEPDVKLFHFECLHGKFTARKEERATSTNEYWTAYRKLDNKLRKVYVGTSDKVTAERLEIIATEISQPESVYYSKKKSYPTKNAESWVTPVDGSSLELNPNSYPSTSKENWVTNDSEVQRLQAEVEELRSQLATVKQERDIFQIQLDKRNDWIGKLVDKTRAGRTGYKTNSFSQGKKAIIDFADEIGL